MRYSIKTQSNKATAKQLKLLSHLNVRENEYSKYFDATPYFKQRV